MKCIEEIENTVKNIIKHIHSVFAEGSLDDTEHIRNVKAVIEGTEAYIRSTKNFSQETGRLKENLYQFARSLWLEHAARIREKNPESDGTASQDEGYAEYCYDHIYHEGNYPR